MCNLFAHAELYNERNMCLAFYKDCIIIVSFAEGETEMKVMLTSFGIEHSLLPTDRERTMFHRMPPVSFRWIKQAFMPDYELLLLCDTVIMDEASFDRLLHGSVAAYSKVADTFQALKSEGRIELADFSSILRPHTELLNKMIDHDIKLLDQWVVPLRESLTRWKHFSKMSMDLMRADPEEWVDQAPFRGIPAPHTMLFHNLIRPASFSVIYHEVAHLISEVNTVPTLSLMVSEALESSEKRKRKEYRAALRDVLRAYLAYVDANLILANQLDVGFHDWLDFTPFYATKFLSVGKDRTEVEENRSQMEKLFTVPFPDLAIRDTRSLMKALNDKRVEDLRNLVAQAARGEIHFDDSFASAVLLEVFQQSERAKKWRNVVGYATLPIGFIPFIGTPAQKAIEEGVGIPLEKRMKRKHRWFYMLSDVAQSRKENPNKGIESDG